MEWALNGFIKYATDRVIVSTIVYTVCIIALSLNCIRLTYKIIDLEKKVAKYEQEASRGV